jgi:hypothetical protein
LGAGSPAKQCSEVDPAWEYLIDKRGSTPFLCESSEKLSLRGFSGVGVEGDKLGKEIEYFVVHKRPVVSKIITSDDTTRWCVESSVKVSNR